MWIDKVKWVVREETGEVVKNVGYMEEKQSETE